MFPDFGKPFTLGSDVFVDNLHAREGVHIDGDSLESTLATKQDTLTGISDVPDLADALDELAPKANPEFTGNLILSTTGSKIQNDATSPASYIELTKTVQAPNLVDPGAGDTTISNAVFIRGTTSFTAGMLFSSTVIQSYQVTTGQFVVMHLNPYGGNVTANTNVTVASDDRIKFNETDILNGLDIVRQMTPERYLKRKPTEPVGTQEAGFIAQKIMNIPDLAFAVTQSDIETVDGDPNSRYYGVDYNSLFTYTTAAVKELDTIVQQQANVIQLLEARIQMLENN